MFVCRGNGECSGQCVPGRRQCAGTTPQVCSTDGQWMNTTGNDCFKQLGAACGTGNECETGNCADGVCCESACSGTCVSCLDSAHGAGNGRCRNVRAGSDPSNECAEATCKTGTCNGNGGCGNVSNGQTATGCNTGAACVNGGASARTADACQNGSCQEGSTMSCGSFGCEGNRWTSCPSGTLPCSNGCFQCCQAGQCPARTNQRAECIANRCEYACAGTTCGSRCVQRGLCFALYVSDGACGDPWGHRVPQGPAPPPVRSVRSRSRATLSRRSALSATPCFQTWREASARQTPMQPRRYVRVKRCGSIFTWASTTETGTPLKPEFAETCLRLDISALLEASGTRRIQRA